MRIPVIAAIALTMSGVLAGVLTQPRPPAYDWQLPDGFPAPMVPEHNRMSRPKVELGRRLFYDTRLSVNGTTACATCHLQALAFTDGRRLSTGATGESTPRNAMSLVNVAYAATLDWANPNVLTLEQQMLTPLFGEEPVEMGLTGHQQRVLAALRDDPQYPALFERAFPADDEPFVWPNLVYAIASFVRSIVSADSPYDDYVRGDPAALDETEIRGLELFLSEELECFHCHGGFNFTDASTHDALNDPPRLFHNNGLYNVGGANAYPPGNTGLHRVTGDPADVGRFKAPTLRNVALTAPYMHDGSIATLDAVVDHYARGGRRIAAGPLAGDGRDNALKSEFVAGFELSDDDRRALLAFLHALTDRSIASNPRWSDPFAEAGR